MLDVLLTSSAADPYRSSMKRRSPLSERNEHSRHHKCQFFQLSILELVLSDPGVTEPMRLSEEGLTEKSVELLKQ